MFAPDKHDGKLVLSMIVFIFFATSTGKSYHGRKYDVSPILSLFSVNKATSKKRDVHELILKFTSNMFD